MVEAESVPGKLCLRWKYTFKGTSVYNRTPRAHTYSSHSNLNVLNLPNGTFLGEPRGNPRRHRENTIFSTAYELFSNSGERGFQILQVMVFLSGYGHSEGMSNVVEMDELRKLWWRKTMEAGWNWWLMENGSDVSRWGRFSFLFLFITLRLLYGFCLGTNKKGTAVGNISGDKSMGRLLCSEIGESKQYYGCGIVPFVSYNSFFEHFHLTGMSGFF